MLKRLLRKNIIEAIGVCSGLFLKILKESGGVSGHMIGRDKKDVPKWGVFFLKDKEAIEKMEVVIEDLD